MNISNNAENSLVTSINLYLILFTLWNYVLYAK